MSDNIYLPSPASTESAEAEIDVAKDLERLAVNFVDVLNARDFDFTSDKAKELRTRMTADWKAQMDTYAADPSPVKFDEQVRRWKLRAQDHTGVHFQVVEVMSKVEEKKERARVFLEMQVSGITEGKLMAMNELRWRKVEGAWLCYFVIGMRGGGVNNAAAMPFPT
ncbi:hypothetical protein LTR78_004259 [Recurvomyces mirabilis]|uniref:Uncharacterized protein n=1 Tax=Recurvomyces mirabilis TaxID=574656 RepID=A0AAE0WQD1_9PEZI|nr:hypothetical protein LTR78_004259 [Recurvomyces mirabilis]KAK5153570.1 hypothetical protein LTS14_007264 [Recurvomyces mirabilis]